MVDKQKEKIRELQQAYNRAKTEEGEASQSAHGTPNKSIEQQVN